jgi:hypothetical protein
MSTHAPLGSPEGDRIIERDLYERDAYHPGAPNYRGDPAWRDDPIEGPGWASLAAGEIAYRINDLITTRRVGDLLVAIMVPDPSNEPGGLDWWVGVTPHEWKLIHAELGRYRILVDIHGPPDGRWGIELPDGSMDHRAGYIGFPVTDGDHNTDIGHPLCRHCAHLLGIKVSGFWCDPGDSDSAAETCAGCGAPIRPVPDEAAPPPREWPEAEEPDDADDIPF